MGKGKLTFESVKLNNKPEHNIVVGMSHFIKTVEDIYELMVNSVPGAKFGVAFCEASGPRLIRRSGSDKKLEDEAVRMAKIIGAGHSFVIVMKDMFPVNILPRLRQVPEFVSVYCATANPVDVIICENDQGRGITGVIDGGKPKGVEDDKEIVERQKFLRQIGYKK